MLLKNGEGMKEYQVIRNGVGEILKINKFGPDETNNKCSMVSELILKPGQCTGFHAHQKDAEIFYMLEGELVYIEDGEEFPFLPGDCTATTNGSKHQIINRSEKEAKVLTVVIK